MTPERFTVDSVLIARSVCGSLTEVQVWDMRMERSIRSFEGVQLLCILPQTIRHKSSQPTHRIHARSDVRRAPSGRGALCGVGHSEDFLSGLSWFDLSMGYHFRTQ